MKTTQRKFFGSRFAKMRIAAVFAALILTVSLSFLSCDDDDDDDDPTYYEITCTTSSSYYEITLVSHEQATAGETITVTAALKDDYKESYQIIDVYAVTSDYYYTFATKSETSETSENTYTFTMPASDVCVYAHTADINETDFYSITVESTSGGSISVSRIKAAYGNTVNIYYHANSGYAFKSASATYTESDETKSLSLTERTLSDGTSYYRFKMPEADVTVSAEFEKTGTGYAVNVSNNLQNGAITVNGSQVSAGSRKSAGSLSTVTVVASPSSSSDETSYMIKSLTVTNDTTQKEIDTTLTLSNDSASGTYTFTMPLSSVTVSAEFEKTGSESYYISSSSSDYYVNCDFDFKVNGSSLSSSPKTAPSGSTVTVSLSISDDNYYYNSTENYTLTGVTPTVLANYVEEDDYYTGDAVYVSSSSEEYTYTFIMPTSNVYVEAYAKLNISTSNMSDTEKAELATAILNAVRTVTRISGYYSTEDDTTTTIKYSSSSSRTDYLRKYIVTSDYESPNGVTIKSGSYRIYPYDGSSSHDYYAYYYADAVYSGKTYNVKYEYFSADHYNSCVKGENESDTESDIEICYLDGTELEGFTN